MSKFWTLGTETVSEHCTHCLIGHIGWSIQALQFQFKRCGGTTTHMHMPCWSPTHQLPCDLCCLSPVCDMTLCYTHVFKKAVEHLTSTSSWTRWKGSSLVGYQAVSHQLNSSSCLQNPSTPYGEMLCNINKESKVLCSKYMFSKRKQYSTVLNCQSNFNKSWYSSCF